MNRFQTACSITKCWNHIGLLETNHGQAASTKRFVLFYSWREPRMHFRTWLMLCSVFSSCVRMWCWSWSSRAWRRSSPWSRCGPCDRCAPSPRSCPPIIRFWPVRGCWMPFSRESTHTLNVLVGVSVSVYIRSSWFICSFIWMNTTMCTNVQLLCYKPKARRRWFPSMTWHTSVCKAVHATCVCCSELCSFPDE